MKQPITINVLAPKAWSPRLNQIAVLLSGLCLAMVFYLNGAFSTSMLSSPQPPANDNIAAGAPLAKATQATSNVDNVATLALAFKATLTTTQQSALEQTYTTALARKWSNLPCGGSCRNGVEFVTFDSTQLAAAQAVIQAATGTTDSNGYQEWVAIRLAEANLHANGGGNGYDTTLRWISFLNTPSATGAWMLQFGGHHYAANIAFNNGHVVGATPFFMGVEPKVFTFNGVTYAPLSDERDAMAAMLGSLTTSELITAKLNQTFSDCVMVPGETNGGTATFPTKVGVACSTLTTVQKNLVLAAMRHYIYDVDSTTANAVMAVYTSQLDSTLISYTGSGTSGIDSTFLNSNTNYVRIDGPQVYIEMSCQNGVVYQGQIHYHTVWRDHVHDYGVDLAGAPIDTTSTTSDTTVTAVNSVKNINTISLYPNPATNEITFSLSVAMNNANIAIINATTGQRVMSTTNYSGNIFNYNVANLPGGMYILKVQDGNTVYTGKFNKL